MVSYIVSSEALSTALVGTQKKFNKGGGLGLGVSVSVCLCVCMSGVVVCVCEKGGVVSVFGGRGGGAT